MSNSLDAHVISWYIRESIKAREISREHFKKVLTDKMGYVETLEQYSYSMELIVNITNSSNDELILGDLGIKVRKAICMVIDEMTKVNEFYYKAEEATRLSCIMSSSVKIPIEIWEQIKSLLHREKELSFQEWMNEYANKSFRDFRLESRLFIEISKEKSRLNDYLNTLVIPCNVKEAKEAYLWCKKNSEIVINSCGSYFRACAGVFEASKILLD